MKNITFDHSLWPQPISNHHEKEQVALKLALQLKDGDIVGVGSGSTSFLILLALADRRSKYEHNFQAVTSSIEMILICQSLEIPVLPLGSVRPRWSFDGADEVDGASSLIKGRGGALFKEKLLIKSAGEVFIAIDESKRVSRLGEKFPVPVEVYPQATELVKKTIAKLPGVSRTELRAAAKKDGPVITENGNLILDVFFDHISKDMEARLKSITGVIESGLFIGYDVTIVSKDSK